MALVVDRVAILIKDGYGAAGKVNLVTNCQLAQQLEDARRLLRQMANLVAHGRLRIVERQQLRAEILGEDTSPQR